MTNESATDPGSPGWETVVAGLRRGRVGDAARDFAAAVGLRIHPADLESDRRAGDGDEATSAETIERLVSLLRRPRPDVIDWWGEVARGWSDVGRASLCRAALGRCRAMIERREAPASWEDLLTLAELDARMPAGDGAVAEASFRGARRIQFEPIPKKLERIGWLFGRALYDPQGQSYRDQVYRAGDLESTIQFLLTAGDSDYGYPMVDLWYRAGESRLAVEHFLAMVAGRSLRDWLREADQALLACGRALTDLGDPVTAYAAFRLAAGPHPVEVAAPTGEQAERQPDREPTVDEQAAEHCRSIDWAGAALESDAKLLRPSTLGPRAADWFDRHGLAGCYPAFLGLFTGYGRVYAVASLQRQCHSLSWKHGWFAGHRRELADGWLADNNRPSWPGSPAPPALDDAASPDRPLVVGRGEAAQPGSPGPDPGAWSRPRPLGSPAGPAPPPLARCQIGYAAVGADGVGDPRVHLEVAPEAPALILGPAADDALILCLARQLRAAGLQILWLRRREAGLAAARLEPEADEWLRIQLDAEADSAQAHWVYGLLNTDSIRQAVRACLPGLLPPCRDPAAGACLDALVADDGRGDVQTALLYGDRAEVAWELAVQVVGERAAISFEHLGDLRRAAVLVEHVAGAVRLLQAATRVRFLPADAPDGILVDLPPEDPAVAALFGLILTGSLLRWAALGRQLAAEAAEEEGDVLEAFDLKIKKRSKAEPTIAEPDWAPRRRPPPPTVAPAPDDPWAERGIATAARPWCVLISGGWGPEWPGLLDWFRHGAMGQYHGLVCAARSAEAALLRRGLLDRFATILLGALPREVLGAFEVASGIALRADPSVPGLGRREAIALRTSPDRVGHSRLVIWPDVEASRRG
jgi:hypothetical protein